MKTNLFYKPTFTLVILFIIATMTQFVAFSQTTVIDSILLDGLQRSYRLYVPSIYNSTSADRPLVINMHGYTSNATQQEQYTKFSPIADTANFLVVYPQGTYIPSTTDSYWNANFYPTGVDDIQFISNLIDTLVANYRIDVNRIYATGFSNGGFMSHTLACELSDKIAAIASVSGTMAIYTQYGVNGSLCNPTRPVPVMQIHGDADNVVPYNGGASINLQIAPVDSVLNFWIHHNNCNSTPSVDNIPDIDTWDNCTATHYLWNGGDLGVTIELYRINLGGHTWPGSFPINIWEATNQDMNAPKEIWRFFNSHQLGGTDAGLTSVNKDHFTIDVYPNPTKDVLYIKTTVKTNITIQDVCGKTVLNGTNNTVLDVSHLESGVYFVVDLLNNSKVKFIKE
ncbi:MAG: T9SS type A sorting domain-containing protein [Crocinitomicaceae bacterium]|nr:T9SS type A sorting domain-containing protein [Crocinitomicaceae bacterium]